MVKVHRCVICKEVCDFKYCRICADVLERMERDLMMEKQVTIEKRIVVYIAVNDRKTDKFEGFVSRERSELVKMTRQEYETKINKEGCVRIKGCSVADLIRETREEIKKMRSLQSFGVPIASSSQHIQTTQK